MTFHEVAVAFDRMRQESSRTEITKQLAALFMHASPDEASYIAYLALGELYPPYRGTIFSIAERSAYKIAAQVLESSATVVKEQADQVGDIGTVIEQAAWGVDAELSLTEVYNSLCMVEQVSGTGSQEKRLMVIAQLLRSLQPLGAAFVLRILVGKLRLGFSDMTMIDALSWMLRGDKSARDIIEHAYNVSADIGRIAAIARAGGLEALQQVSITPGIPIRPAAAERLPDAQSIVDKLGSCVVQPKLDGFRLQVHVWHDQGVQHVRFFSRNLQSMQGMFPELEIAIKSCTADSFIMEGEAIAYDEETGTYLHFQETVKRRRKHNIAEAAEAYPLKLVLFDLLYYQGESYLQKVHHERYKTLQALMQRCATAYAPSLAIIEEVKIQSAGELELYFMQLVSHGLEGIIAKRDDAYYQPGKRNFNWIKLKRQSVGNLADTIDAVVLGYYYGRGKRAAFGIGACLVGVLDATTHQFVTIAKIGTGLSDEEWKQLHAMCEEHKVDHKPSSVLCSPLLYPDVWVEPAIVLEIAADEITRSPLHTAARDAEGYGLALRFPRMVSFRTDKSVMDITTVAEVKSLFRAQV